MELKDLYFAGVNFEAFMGAGIKSERDRIPKNYSRIKITDEEIEIVKNCNKKIKFLVSGEPWCTDFQLNTTVLKKFCELNSNFDMAIITKGRGEKFLKPILGICIVMDIIGSIKVFDLIFVMTEGGPNGLTNMPSWLL